MTQCRRNASNEKRNSLHPTQGSKRESLAHPCMKSKQPDSFQLLGMALLKRELQSRGGHGCGLFWLCCRAERSSFPPNIFFFFTPPTPPPHLLFAFLLFVCLFFNIRTLDFACPWKTLWLNRNNNMGVKAEKLSGKGFCKWGSPSILQKDLAASAIANTVLTAEHWIIWPWTCADTQPHTLLVGSLWRCHRVSLIPGAQAASIRRVSRRGWSAEKLPPSPGRKVTSKRDLCCCFASCSYGLVSAIRGVVAGFCSSVSCLCSWEGFKRLAG